MPYGIKSSLQSNPWFAEEIALGSCHVDDSEAIHNLLSVMVAFAEYDWLMTKLDKLGGEIVHVILDAAQLMDIPTTNEDDFHEGEV